jgi:DNA-binding NtrC family response regulator
VSKLLVVDDEPSICWGLARMGEAIGHEVLTAASAERALELAAEIQPDVIVLDIRLPNMDGLTAMEQLRQRVGDVPIIVITAFGDLQTAVDAVRQGAFDYIVKPFSLELVRSAVLRALDRRSHAPPDQLPPAAVEGIIGKTPIMQEVFKRIALAADSQACVLLTGESGTGKELAARAMHKYSPRAAGPFVAVNVAALSPALAESELFGHDRGAFTGADRARPGLLQQADGGTLFLDEVADIPLPTQVKLLRALERGEVLPVGCSTPVASDFRVISATHRNLLQRVEEGSFRHDLYFRLCAFSIELPPLRERRGDIPALAAYFISQLASARDGRCPSISQTAMAELQSRDWYGNVRELRNAVEHARIVARGGEIFPEHLPPPLTAPLAGRAGASKNTAQTITAAIRRWALEVLGDPSQAEQIYQQLLDIVEPPLLQAALEKHKGQFAAAARELGLHRTTLRKKMDQHQVREDAPHTDDGTRHDDPHE